MIRQESLEVNPQTPPEKRRARMAICLDPGEHMDGKGTYKFAEAGLGGKVNIEGFVGVASAVESGTVRVEGYVHRATASDCGEVKVLGNVDIATAYGRGLVIVEVGPGFETERGELASGNVREVIASDNGMIAIDGNAQKVNSTRKGFVMVKGNADEVEADNANVEVEGDVRVARADHGAFIRIGGKIGERHTYRNSKIVSSPKGVQS